MNTFDYRASAELFTNRSSKWSRRGSVGYKRFDQAAEAIRYVIEGLPGASLASAWLEVGDDRFNASDIRRLYEDQAYPLDRQEPRPVPSQEQGVVRRDASPATKRPLWWSTNS
jgi:hypothetical protein